MAVPTTHARSSGHQVRRTAPVPPRGACLRRTGQARRVNKHPMPCLVDRLEPCALRLAGIRKARDPDCEVHNRGDRRARQQVGAFGQVQLRQRGPLSGSPVCPSQGRELHTPQARRRGRGTERGRVLLVSTRRTGKDIPRVGARTLAPGNHAPSAAIACGARPAAKRKVDHAGAWPMRVSNRSSP